MKAASGQKKFTLSVPVWTRDRHFVTRVVIKTANMSDMVLAWTHIGSIYPSAKNSANDPRDLLSSLGFLITIFHQMSINDKQNLCNP